MDFIQTDKAPGAVGPYSQAVRVAGFVYTAGQVGINPEVGTLVSGGVEEEARQALKNLEAVLDASGSGLSSVVKTTVFVTDIADFPRVNAIYAEAFGDHRPARSLVQAAALPLGATVEIEAVGRVDS
ncbi:MAG: RidA family protein [Candidatus Eisenbacteria bacterium]|uniref:RidA family protein n=1 Tax=Eiseniibacteriota bacterium TaxID=2212470 RepID=A0A7Y2H118_UNCEI|nr:RidA family protein [Candidatus Eisenbacteria bacterium]